MDSNDTNWLTIFLFTLAGCAAVAAFFVSPLLQFGDASAFAGWGTVLAGGFTLFGMGILGKLDKWLAGVGALMALVALALLVTEMLAAKNAYLEWQLKCETIESRLGFSDPQFDKAADLYSAMNCAPGS